MSNPNDPVQIASVDAFINGIYGNLFNREADVPGLAFWQNAVLTGQISFGSIVFMIENGTSNGADAAVFANKVQASLPSAAGALSAPIVTAATSIATAATPQIQLRSKLNISGSSGPRGGAQVGSSSCCREPGGCPSACSAGASPNANDFARGCFNGDANAGSRARSKFDGNFFSVAASRRRRRLSVWGGACAHGRSMRIRDWGIFLKGNYISSASLCHLGERVAFIWASWWARCFHLDVLGRFWQFGSMPNDRRAIGISWRWPALA